MIMSDPNTGHNRWALKGRRGETSGSPAQTVICETTVRRTAYVHYVITAGRRRTTTVTTLLTVGGPRVTIGTDSSLHTRAQLLTIVIVYRIYPANTRLIM